MAFEAAHFLPVMDLPQADRAIGPAGRQHVPTRRERHRLHRPLVPYEAAQQFALHAVPQADHLVADRDGQVLAVRRERQGHHVAREEARPQSLLAGGRLEQAQLLLDRDDGHQLAVGRQRHGGRGHARQLQQLLAGGDVPQPHRAVLAAGHEDLAIGGKGGGV